MSKVKAIKPKGTYNKIVVYLSKKIYKYAVTKGEWGFF